MSSDSHVGAVSIWRSIERAEAEAIVDPGVLEILGAVAEILGVADHVQKLLPLDRLRIEHRHRRVRKLLEEFSEHLQGARAALRVVSSVVTIPLSSRDSEHGAKGAELPRDAIAFGIPRSDLPVLQRGLTQLHSAIAGMTKSAYALEAASAGVPDEVQRFYRISESGQKTLSLLRSAINGDNRQVPAALVELEGFLARCSDSIEERSGWLLE